MSLTIKSSLFENNILPTIIIFGGIATNLLVVIILSSKTFKIKPLEPARFMNILAVNDALYLLVLMFSIDNSVFNYIIPPMVTNIYACKIISFSLLYLNANSSWILVFISLERLLTVKFSNIKYMKSMRFKLGLIGFIYLLNFLLYCPNLILNKIKFSIFDNGSEIKLSCLPTNFEIFYIQMLISAINTIAIPFVIMLFCSILIIYSIYETRKRQATQQAINEQKKLKRDIQLSVTIVTVDIIFLIFNTPQLIEQFLVFGSSYLRDMDPRTLNLLNMFYFLQYGVNFFIYMFVYLRFRKVFCYIFLNF